MTDSVDMAAGQAGVGGGVQQPETAKPPQYIGRLERGPQPDTICGFISDMFGWRIRIEGVRDAEHGGYRLRAWLDGEVPQRLRQPVLDENA